MVSVSDPNFISTSLQAWHSVPHALFGRWPQPPYATGVCEKPVSEMPREEKSLIQGHWDRRGQ